jgi:hypothetical protein
MSTRHRIVSALVRMYPAEWRREYGPELTDILLAGRLGPRAIANVFGSACRERLRSAELRHLLLRALVAFIVMELLTGASAAIQYEYGPGREFGGPFGVALFLGFVTAPMYVGALFGAIVPVAVLLGPLRRRAGLPVAAFASAGVGVAAFAGVLLVFWVIDRSHFQTFGQFLVTVFRGQGTSTVLAALIAGSAIVVSGRPRSRATSDRQDEPSTV